MIQHADYVLIGGGLAAATAAQTLRREGATGSILLLSEERLPPYQRPPLTKQVLRGKISRDGLFVLSDEALRALSIELRLGARVVALNTAERVVVTEAAGSFSYRRLLIATGASPLSLPGVESGTASIFYLRTLADAERLHRAAEQASSALILGGIWRDNQGENGASIKMRRGSRAR